MSTLQRALPFIAAMAVVVAASNYLVQFQFHPFGLGDILTWGAFTYPVAFLVNDLANRRHGPQTARLAIYAGFVLAVGLSIWLATPRIAIASGTAFLLAQLLDARIFNALRQASWWKAPFLSTLIGSLIDTVLFFSIAFSATFAGLDRITGMEDGSLAVTVTILGAEVPLWVSLALGDFAVKVATGLLMLAPYGVIVRNWFAATLPARG